MQYQCPKCQSRKIMPQVSPNTPAVRPNIPKSLVILVPALFILLLLVVVSVVMMIFSDGAGQTLQVATVIAFVIALFAGVMFWRDLPDFKISMQAFMQSQRKWKCRDCNHEWEN